TGQIGAGKLTLINEAKWVIDALAGALILNVVTTGKITNTGLMEATSGGLLDVRSDIANAGGTLGGFGGTVQLNASTIRGGTLIADATGALAAAGNATL